MRFNNVNFNNMNFESRKLNSCNPENAGHNTGCSRAAAPKSTDLCHVLGGKLKFIKRTALSVIASAALFTVNAQAAVIIEPGVEIKNESDAPFEASDASITNAEENTEGSPAATADASVTAAEQAANTDENPGIIYAPGVKLEENGPEKNADNDSSEGGQDTVVGKTETGTGTGAGAASGTEVNTGTGTETSESGLSADDPASVSLRNPNTLIPTENADIFYINGRKIDIKKPSIALTFDDGPQSSVGNRIMDTMAKYGQKCTFFMVGDRVAARADEVRRMISEGHEAANHTYGHIYLNKIGAEAVRNQVNACNDIIEQISGVRPTVMRLPGGNKNETVLGNVNMPVILWNIDTRDWATRNAESTKSAVIGHVKDGDIVLMHELYESTADAVETIVPTLTEQGFQLVTVSELAAIKGVTLLPNRVYYSF